MFGISSNITNGDMRISRNEEYRDEYGAPREYVWENTERMDSHYSNTKLESTLTITTENIPGKNGIASCSNVQKQRAPLQIYSQTKRGKIRCCKTIGARDRTFKNDRFGFIFCCIIVMFTSQAVAEYYQDYASLALKKFTKIACEREYLFINCPDGFVIDVKDAMYGRKMPSSEICPSSNYQEGSAAGRNFTEDTNCEAKAGSECQDKRVCRLLVFHRVFGGDPCPGTSKYLTVQYQCVPSLFQLKKSCSDGGARLKCRQGSVLAIYFVTPSIQDECQEKTNSSSCSEAAVFDEVNAKCHSKSKCSYVLPPASCFNHVTITHACVPKSFLTSEIPTFRRLQATTAPYSPTTAALDLTSRFSTTEVANSTVQSTVTTHTRSEGYSSDFSSTTSFPIKEEKTIILLGNLSDSITTTYPATLQTNVNTSATKESTSSKVAKTNAQLIQENDFAVDDLPVMDENSTECVNCSASSSDLSGFLQFIVFVENNKQDILITILLCIIVALLLIICILVFRRRKEKLEKDSKDLDRVTEETREDNRQSIEEHHSIANGAEATAEEDEHESMSLLGSILQRSVGSNNTASRQPMSQNSSFVNANTTQPQVEDAESENEPCGPKSIFGKICCNCCCSNPPWQRTRILKRHRGDVYHVRHRYSSSSDDDDLAGEFRSHDTFPPFSRTDDNPDNPSPIPRLEERVNRTEQSIVASPGVPSRTSNSPAVISQSQPNFRPISRNTQRHHSVTPDPDSRYRIQQNFQPQQRQQETQRSDPALNRYTVRQSYNVPQPLTAPTSPVIGLHQNGTPNGAHGGRGFPLNSHKPVMGSSMLQSSQQHHPPTPKYTPPPNHFYGANQLPTFPYEQYDNAPETSQVVRRKHFPPPRDYSSPYSQYSSNNFSFPTSSTYEDDHFVQAVPRHNILSSARTVDLAANARTVDLAHDNTLSRNSWLEIRRNSIYDNSLPRNGEMFSYHPQFLPNDYPMSQLQLQLPGTRNLNHYYP